MIAWAHRAGRVPFRCLARWRAGPAVHVGALQVKVQVLGSCLLLAEEVHGAGWGQGLLQVEARKRPR
jgi:hypothetical protein